MIILNKAYILKSKYFKNLSHFFFAGTDTTSSFTEMMIYLISKHKEVEIKVRKEI